MIGDPSQQQLGMYTRRARITVPLIAAALVLLTGAHATSSQAGNTAQDRAACEAEAPRSYSLESCLQMRALARRRAEAQANKKIAEPITILGGLFAIISLMGWATAARMERTGGGYRAMEKGFGALFFLSGIAVTASSIYASMKAGGAWIGRRSPAWVPADDQLAVLGVVFSKAAVICVLAYLLWRHLNRGLPLISTRAARRNSGSGKAQSPPPGTDQSSP